MARRIKNWQTPGRPSKRPWRDWLSGKTGVIWQLTKGKDYQCDRESMIVQIYQYATKFKVSVSVRRDEYKGKEVIVIINKGKRKAA